MMECYLAGFDAVQEQHAIISTFVRSPSPTPFCPSAFSLDMLCEESLSSQSCINTRASGWQHETCEFSSCQAFKASKRPIGSFETTAAERLGSMGHAGGRRGKKGGGGCFGPDGTKPIAAKRRACQLIHTNCPYGFESKSFNPCSTTEDFKSFALGLEMGKRRKTSFRSLA